MFKLSKPKKIVVTLIVAGAVVAGSGAAYAYWSTTGSGTGSVSAVAAAIPLTAVQTSTISTLAPGVAAQTLAGNFTNTNTGVVRVATVSVSIASVFKAGSPAVGCDATDYTIASSPMTVNAEIPVGSAQGAWTGATIQFNNKATNQDACKGTVVNLTYTIA